MAVSSAKVYIFLGPELGKKNDAVNAVKAKISNAEEYVFYAGETSINIVADTLLNISLFAEKRIIIVKNAELIKKKDEVELLTSCLKNMEENTALILLSDEYKLAAGLEDACLQGAPKANRQIFYELFEKEKHEWIKQFFRREGFNIEKDCIDVILEMVENNTDALKRECSRLIHFAKGQAIESEEQTDKSKGQIDKLEGQIINLSLCEVEKWLFHNREESPFTLFSRIAAGDLSKALESLAIMLAAKESASGIMASLTSCFRKLSDYLSLIETGNSNNSFELKKIGLSSPKAKDDYAAASRRYNAESVEACLAVTAEYETLLRSPAAVMENILMDRYIVTIINHGITQKKN